MQSRGSKVLVFCGLILGAAGIVPGHAMTTDIDDVTRNDAISEPISVTTPPPPPLATPIIYSGNMAALGGGISGEIVPNIPDNTDGRADAGEEGSQEDREEENCDSTSYTKNPVQIATGRKVLNETDAFIDGTYPFAFKRHYGFGGDQTTKSGILGTRWRTTFDVRLAFKPTGMLTYCVNRADRYCDGDASTPQVAVDDADGSRKTFTYNSTLGYWAPSNLNSIEKIFWSETFPAGWEYHRADNGVDKFNRWGERISSKDIHGIGWSFTFNVGKLISATHTSGRTFTFGWTGSNVTSMTDPAGLVTNYSWSGGDLLVTQGGVTRTYGASSVKVNGAVYREWVNGTNGKVSSSGLVGGVEKDTFAYGSDSTTVTNAAGASTKYIYTTDTAGRKLLTNIERTGVTNCPSAFSQRQYDSNGFQDWEVDWKGNTTDYYYNARGQLERIETGLNPAFPNQSRVVVTDWDTTVIQSSNAVVNRPSTIKRYGAGEAELLSETILTYYPAGDPAAHRLLEIKTINRSARGIYNQERATRYSYAFHSNGMPSQIVIDGPLPLPAEEILSGSSIRPVY